MEEDLKALLAWRKGAIPLLREIPVLRDRVALLQKTVNKLAMGNAEPKTKQRVGATPYASTEQVESAFLAAYALPTKKGDGSWYTLEDIVASLLVDTTPRSLGQILGQLLNMKSVVRRIDCKAKRAYFLRRV
jgi:hypothetical protein